MSEVRVITHKFLQFAVVAASTIVVADRWAVAAVK